MELSSKRKSKEIKVDGDPVQLLVPTWKEIRSYEKLVKNKTEDESADHLIDFITNLGLDKDLVENLDVETLRDLIVFVSPKKK